MYIIYFPRQLCYSYTILTSDSDCIKSNFIDLVDFANNQVQYFGIRSVVFDKVDFADKRGTSIKPILSRIESVFFN